MGLRFIFTDRILYFFLLGLHLCVEWQVDACKVSRTDQNYSLLPSKKQTNKQKHKSDHHHQETPSIGGRVGKK